MKKININWFSVLIGTLVLGGFITGSTLLGLSSTKTNVKEYNYNSNKDQFISRAKTSSYYSYYANIPALISLNNIETNNNTVFEIGTGIGFTSYNDICTISVKTSSKTYDLFSLLDLEANRKMKEVDNNPNLLQPVKEQQKTTIKEDLDEYKKKITESADSYSLTVYNPETQQDDKVSYASWYDENTKYFSDIESNLFRIKYELKNNVNANGVQLTEGEKTRFNDELTKGNEVYSFQKAIIDNKAWMVWGSVLVAIFGVVILGYAIFFIKGRFF